MTFYDFFKAVVAGKAARIIALSGVAGGVLSCEYPDDCGKSSQVVNRRYVVAEDEALNRTVDAALTAHEETNPMATADEKLLLLFSGTSPLLRGDQITELVKDLIVAASMEPAGLSAATCQAICDPSGWDRFDGCAVTEPPDSPAGTLGQETALFCYGETIKNCDGAGRRPAGLQREAATVGDLRGRWWAHVAHLEAAAVHAFSRLAAELTLFGAPQNLIDGCTRAAVEEVHHARLTGALAVRRGVQPPPVEVAEFEPRSRFEVALDNATEGCVRETWAGLEAIYQAEHTSDEAERGVLAQIAEDECGHAELSWAIHRWLMPLLTPAEREVIEAARAGALDALAADLSERTGPEFDAVGLPGAQACSQMFDGFRAAERHLTLASSYT